MYEKTKKEIYNLIKLNTESIDWKTPEIVTTGEISRQLNISRNLCSHYLNDMPDILSLGIFVLVYWLLKKGTKATTILFGIIVVSIVGSAAGIF